MGKKQRKVITFRAESPDTEAIEAIRAYYGLSSDNQAIGFSLREIARQVQRKEAGKERPVGRGNSSPT